MDSTISEQQPVQQFQTPTNPPLTPSPSIPPPNNKNKVILVSVFLLAIILLLFIIFYLLVLKPIKKQPINLISPTQILSPSLQPTFTPQVVQQKSSSEMYVDIKNQLIKAFK